jgi:hypothetical protein
MRGAVSIALAYNQVPLFFGVITSCVSPLNDCTSMCEHQHVPLVSGIWLAD